MIKTKTKKFLSLFNTPIKIIVSYYMLFIFIGSIFLYLPVSHQNGVSIDYIDSLFLSSSAVSTTGLSTVTHITDVFNYFGLFVIFILIQFGGVGVITLGAFLWILIGKKISFQERSLIIQDFNLTTAKGIVTLIRKIFIYVIIIEVIGTLLLFISYMPYLGDIENFGSIFAVFTQAVFGSVSSYTNAGFDITGASLVPFRDNYFILSVHIILIILGGIGYPVFYEIQEFLKAKKHKKYFKFSLFFKLTVMTYAILFLLGTLVFLTFEYGNENLGDISFVQLLYDALFTSATTRSAGLQTFEQNLLTTPTNFFNMFLMFVGGSPSSSGGGLRTTTIAIVVLSFIATLKNKEHIVIFKREISNTTVRRALSITLVSTFWIFLTLFVIMIFEPNAQKNMFSYIYETISAFGTVGLSQNITTSLSIQSKLAISILMLIGRVGSFTFLLMFTFKQNKTSKISYPRENIQVG